MPLDPEIATVLKLIEEFDKDRPPLWKLPLPEARRALEMMAAEAPEVKVGGVEDTKVDGRGGKIPVRVYTPIGGNSLGTVVFYHGGGFVLGSIGMYDPVCRTITSESGCTVISVDYRLAPEHKAPAAIEDAYDSLQWAIKKMGARGVAVAGDSAGGNLAATVSMMARDQRGGVEKIKLQVLAYPVLDLGSFTPTAVEYGEHYFLTRDMAIWFSESYLVDRNQASDPHISPLRAPDVSGLPPAVILTGEYDPLRDQGETYAARLRTSGVPVVGIRYTGAIHGFLSFAGTRITASALSMVSSSLKSAFT